MYNSHYYSFWLNNLTVLNNYLVEGVVDVSVDEGNLYIWGNGRQKIIWILLTRPAILLRVENRGENLYHMHYLVIYVKGSVVNAVV